MRKRKYTKEFLVPLVKESHSYTELLRLLDLKVNGGNHRTLTTRIKEYEINTSHFTGQLWNKGKTKESDVRVKNNGLNARMPDSLVFCRNSGFATNRLYKRLLELGWKDECSECKIDEWLGKPIRIHVDHKNGNHSDNRLENLRFLCPNCHQQTDTWGAKNKHA